MSSNLPFAGRSCWKVGRRRFDKSGFLSGLFGNGFRRRCFLYECILTFNGKRRDFVCNERDLTLLGNFFCLVFARTFMWTRREVV